VSMGSELRDRPLTEAAADSAFLEAWLSQAFASWPMAQGAATPR